MAVHAHTHRHTQTIAHIPEEVDKHTIIQRESFFSPK